MIYLFLFILLDDPDSSPVSVFVQMTSSLWFWSVVEKTNQCFILDMRNSVFLLLKFWDHFCSNLEKRNITAKLILHLDLWFPLMSYLSFILEVWFISYLSSLFLKIQSFLFVIEMKGLFWRILVRSGNLVIGVESGWNWSLIMFVLVLIWMFS